jgi:hypothetical protein
MMKSADQFTLFYENANKQKLSIKVNFSVYFTGRYLNATKSDM